MSFLRRPVAAVAAAAVFAALPLGAFAQATVAIPAPQKHACVKPGEHPGKLATDNQIRTWTRSANAYLECVKKFIGEQQAAAKPYQDAARVHIEAGNAAVEEFNAAVKDFKEQQDKASAD
jgi:hypothetical protein